MEILIIIIIGIWMLKRYSSHKEQEKKQEQIEEIDKRLENNRIISKVKAREELISLRKARLRDIRRHNAAHLQNGGVIWEDEKAAMHKYDKQYYEKWKDAGMIPPSFTKDGEIGYINPEQAIEENKIYARSELERLERITK